MLNLNSILIGSESPKELAAFYEKLIDKKPDWAGEGGGDFVGWKVGDGWLTIGPHDKVKGKNPNPERILINFETEDVKAAFDRALELGAEKIRAPYTPGEEDGMSIATCADPDGNYFQFMTPFEG